jgi:hypothetical protein
MIKRVVLKTRHRAGTEVQSAHTQKPPKIVERLTLLAWPEPWSIASHQAAPPALNLQAMTMKPSNFNCAHN